MKFEIIPAIDIMDGKCVRLSEGVFSSKKIYNGSPLDTAKSFEACGITRLHIIDLDGAACGRVVNYRSLERIALNTNLTIDFGGGIQTNNDINTAFDAGAHMVISGTIAVKERDTFCRWMDKFSPDKLILGADFRNRKISTNGWTASSEFDLFDFMESYLQDGLRTAICTDISKDGMLTGPSLEIYRELAQTFPTLNIIASGGVSSIEDVEAARKTGCSGIIIGKAIYENKVTLPDLERMATALCSP